MKSSERTYIYRNIKHQDEDDLLEHEIPDDVTEVHVDANVRHLPAQTFRKHNALRRLILYHPELSVLGKEVCFGCRNLTQVIFPPTLEEISDHAFAYCRSLQYVKLPKFLKVIGDGAFYYCQQLEQVDIPHTVTTIKRQAFYECQRLKYINTWPDSLELIGKEAFGYCHSLEEVTLSSSVTNLGVNVFHCCVRLQSIDIRVNSSKNTKNTLALAIRLCVDYPNCTPNLGMHRLVSMYATTKQGIKPSELLNSSPQEIQKLVEIQLAHIESIRSCILWCVTTGLIS